MTRLDDIEAAYTADPLRDWSEDVGYLISVARAAEAVLDLDANGLLRAALNVEESDACPTCGNRTTWHAATGLLAGGLCRDPWHASTPSPEQLGERAVDELGEGLDYLAPDHWEKIDADRPNRVPDAYVGTIYDGTDPEAVEGMGSMAEYLERQKARCPTCGAGHGIPWFLPGVQAGTVKDCKDPKHTQDD